MDRCVWGGLVPNYFRGAAKTVGGRRCRPTVLCADLGRSLRGHSAGDWVGSAVAVTGVALAWFWPR
jgi:hypothetical protein